MAASGTRILITGGAGFIGSHVVDRMVAHGHDLVVLDNLDPQVHGANAALPRYLQQHIDIRAVEFIRGDVRSEADVERALRGVDTVVHLAAAVGVGQSMYAPHYYADVNVAGQAQLLQAMARDAARFRRLVVASSMSIYGEGAYRCALHGAQAAEPRSVSRLEARNWEVACPVCGMDMHFELTTEQKQLDASSIYAITKKTQEEMALCFGRAYRIPTIALRLFNVYGSRQSLANPYTGAAAIFLTRIKQGKSPLVFEDGEQSRDFLHVADAANAVTRAVEVDCEGATAVNVCTGRRTTIAALARILAKRIGAPIVPEILSRYRAGDVRHCVGDPSAAVRDLAFTAAVRLEDGLDELSAWAQSEESMDGADAEVQKLERHGLLYG